MSTTTNVQSFLPYIFRPTYTYSAAGFATTFNIRNIDTITANSVTAVTVDIGDSLNNVYVGRSSGNIPTSMLTKGAVSTTMIGNSAGSGQSNTTNVECIGYTSGQGILSVSNSSFIGAYAGASSRIVNGSLLIGTDAGRGSSNISNSIAIGQNVLSNVTTAANVIAVGTNTAVGTSNANGGSNIYIGNSNSIGIIGAGNIIIGHKVTPAQYTVGGVVTSNPSNMSNKLFIGSGNNILIAGDFSNGCVSIGTTNTTPNSLNGPNYSPIPTLGLQLDVAKYVRIGYGLGIGVDPGNYQLDVNGPMHIADGSGGDLVFAPPVYGSLNGALTLKSTAVGGTMTLSVDGSIIASGDVTALSDERFKSNIITVSNALTMVENLRGVYFTPISDPTVRKIGLIAQEVEKVVPEVVLTETGGDKKKSISYGNVVGLLIEAVKELSEQVRDLNLKLLGHLADRH